MRASRRTACRPSFAQATISLRARGSAADRQGMSIPRTRRSARAKTPRAATPSRPKKAAPTAPKKRDSQHVIERMMAAIKRPTDAEREAFRSRCPDAQCDARGAATRARDVLAETERAITGKDAVVKKYAAQMRYGETRFGFLLECVQNLRAEIEHQDASRKQGGAFKWEVTRLTDEGKAHRTDLYGTLDEVVGEVTGADRDALDEAYGSAETPDGLCGSLLALADVAEDWLAREDSIAQSLVHAHELTRDDVDRARRVAQELKIAREGARECVAGSRDTPATNRAEGRVLFEVEVLDRAVRRVREKDRTVASLTLGPTLRRVLRKNHAKTEDADEAPATPTPANPPAQPA